MPLPDDFIVDLETKFHALKDLRKAAGMTQKEVANHLGVDQTTISKWENGVQVPAWAEAVRLCRLLDNIQLRLAAQPED